MRAAIVWAALLAPALASGDGLRPRLALSLDGALSRYPQTPHLAAGGRLMARLWFGEAALALDWAAREPQGETGYRSSVLLAGGVAYDASPLVSLHLHGIVGGYDVRLREYVYGGWRHESQGALGGELAVRLHPPASLARMGSVRLWPVAGFGITVLYLGPRSDRLRGAEWGGTQVVATLTVGAELTGPARHAPPR